MDPFGYGYGVAQQVIQDPTLLAKVWEFIVANSAWFGYWGAGTVVSAGFFSWRKGNVLLGLWRSASWPLQISWTAGKIGLGVCREIAVIGKKTLQIGQ